MVRLDGTMSTPFECSKGGTQGCILLPAPFNIYGDHIIRKRLDGWRDQQHSGMTKNQESEIC